MNRRIIRRVALWLSVGVVIMGCASPMFVTPPPVSTTAPGALETTIAQTVDAAQTQTAVNIPPSRTPTYTPLPTKTATVTPSPTATILFITETNVPSDSLLEEGGFEEEENGGSNFSANSNSDSDSKNDAPKIREWDCRILSKSPANGAVIPAGTKFQAIWTVKNAGSKIWPSQGVDVVYASGASLHEGKSYRDIPSTVGPGGSLTITVTLTAPKRPGDYSTRWSLMVGKTQFCGVRFKFTSQ